jgi:hypothetical protein
MVGLLLVSGVVSLFLLLCIIAHEEVEGVMGLACGYIGIAGYFALAATDALRRQTEFQWIDYVIWFIGNWTFYSVMLWAVSKMTKRRRKTT